MQKLYCRGIQFSAEDGKILFQNPSGLTLIGVFPGLDTMFFSIAELAINMMAKSDSGPFFIIKILLELGHTHLLIYYLCLCLHYNHGVKYFCYNGRMK